MSLPRVQYAVNCSLCGCNGASHRCVSCNSMSFCDGCDAMYHRHPKRRQHLREPLVQHFIKAVEQSRKVEQQMERLKPKSPLTSTTDNQMANGQASRPTSALSNSTLRGSTTQLYPWRKPKTSRLPDFFQSNPNISSMVANAKLRPTPPTTPTPPVMHSAKVATLPNRSMSTMNVSMMRASQESLPKPKQLPVIGEHRLSSSSTVHSQHPSNMPVPPPRKKKTLSFSTLKKTFKKMVVGGSGGTSPSASTEHIYATVQKPGDRQLPPTPEERTARMYASSADIHDIDSMYPSQRAKYIEPDARSMTMPRRRNFSVADFGEMSDSCLSNSQQFMYFAPNGHHHGSQQFCGSHHGSTQSLYPGMVGHQGRMHSPCCATTMMMQHGHVHPHQNPGMGCWGCSPGSMMNVKGAQCRNCCPSPSVTSRRSRKSSFNGSIDGETMAKFDQTEDDDEGEEEEEEEEDRFTEESDGEIDDARSTDSGTYAKKNRLNPSVQHQRSASVKQRSVNGQLKIKRAYSISSDSEKLPGSRHHLHHRGSVRSSQNSSPCRSRTQTSTTSDNLSDSSSSAAPEVLKASPKSSLKVHTESSARLHPPQFSASSPHASNKPETVFEEPDCCEETETVNHSTGEWSCRFCTFVNQSLSKICEMCAKTRISVIDDGKVQSQNQTVKVLKHPTPHPVPVSISNPEVPEIIFDEKFVNEQIEIETEMRRRMENEKRIELENLHIETSTNAGTSDADSNISGGKSLNPLTENASSTSTPASFSNVKVIFGDVSTVKSDLETVQPSPSAHCAAAAAVVLERAPLSSPKSSASNTQLQRPSMLENSFDPEKQSEVENYELSDTDKLEHKQETPCTSEHLVKQPTTELDVARMIEQKISERLSQLKAAEFLFQQQQEQQEQQNRELEKNNSETIPEMTTIGAENSKFEARESSAIIVSRTNGAQNLTTNTAMKAEIDAEANNIIAPTSTAVVSVKNTEFEKQNQQEVTGYSGLLSSTGVEQQHPTLGCSTKQAEQNVVLDKCKTILSNEIIVTRPSDTNVQLSTGQTSEVASATAATTTTAPIGITQGAEQTAYQSSYQIAQNDFQQQQQQQQHQSMGAQPQQTDGFQQSTTQHQHPQQQQHPIPANSASQVDQVTGYDQYYYSHHYNNNSVYQHHPQQQQHPQQQHPVQFENVQQQQQQQQNSYPGYEQHPQQQQSIQQQSSAPNSHYNQQASSSNGTNYCAPIDSLASPTASSFQHFNAQYGSHSSGVFAYEGAANNTSNINSSNLTWGTAAAASTTENYNNGTGDSTLNAAHLNSQQQHPQHSQQQQQQHQHPQQHPHIQYPNNDANFQVSDSGFHHLSHHHASQQPNASSYPANQPASQHLYTHPASSSGYFQRQDSWTSMPGDLFSATGQQASTSSAYGSRQMSTDDLYSLSSGGGATTSGSFYYGNSGFQLAGSSQSGGHRNSMLSLSSVPEVNNDPIKSGLEIVQTLRDAERKGYSADDVEVAIQFAPDAPIEWLDTNWRSLCETVQSLTNNRIIEQCRSRIPNQHKVAKFALATENDARTSLHIARGNVWQAVDCCVKIVQKKKVAQQMHRSITKLDQFQESEIENLMNPENVFRKLNAYDDDDDDDDEEEDEEEESEGEPADDERHRLTEFYQRHTGIQDQHPQQKKKSKHPSSTARSFASLSQSQHSPMSSQSEEMQKLTRIENLIVNLQNQEGEGEEEEEENEIAPNRAPVVTTGSGREKRRAQKVRELQRKIGELWRSTENAALTEQQSPSQQQQQHPQSSPSPPLLLSSEQEQNPGIVPRQHPEVPESVSDSVIQQTTTTNSLPLIVQNPQLSQDQEPESDEEEAEVENVSGDFGDARQATTEIGSQSRNNNSNNNSNSNLPTTAPADVHPDENILLSNNSTFQESKVEKFSSQVDVPNSLSQPTQDEVDNRIPMNRSQDQQSTEFEITESESQEMPPSASQQPEVDFSEGVSAVQTGVETLSLPVSELNNNSDSGDVQDAQTFSLKGQSDDEELTNSGVGISLSEDVRQFVSDNSTETVPVNENVVQHSTSLSIASQSDNNVVPIVLPTMAPISEAATTALSSQSSNEPNPIDERLTIEQVSLQLPESTPNIEERGQQLNDHPTAPITGSTIEEQNEQISTSSQQPIVVFENENDTSTSRSMGAESTSTDNGNVEFFSNGTQHLEKNVQPLGAITSVDNLVENENLLPTELPDNGEQNNPLPVDSNISTAVDLKPSKKIILRRRKSDSTTLVPSLPASSESTSGENFTATAVQPATNDNLIIPESSFEPEVVQELPVIRHAPKTAQRPSLAGHSSAAALVGSNSLVDFGWARSEFECELCANLVPLSETVSLITCTHYACRDCLSKYYTVQIRERQRLVIPCPFCEEPSIDADDDERVFEHLALFDPFVRHLVDEETYELYQRKTRDRALMRDPNFIWCPQCSSGFISPNPCALTVTCPDCRAITCRKCRQPWRKQHFGIGCDEFARWAADNDEEFAEKQLHAHLREFGIECPNCKFQYQLAKGGCMHFRCLACSFDFCGCCSRPFKPGNRCFRARMCASLGLHAHHPRNCLFYLRDKTVGDLEKLLIENSIDFRAKLPASVVESAETPSTPQRCQVMEQKETETGRMKDEPCNRLVESSTLCRMHYKEYLGTLIFKHHIDPILIFSDNELELVLRRENIHLPNRTVISVHNGTDVKAIDAEYRAKLLELIDDRVPLNLEYE